MFALLVAAIFALGLVPTGALGADSGRMDVAADTGTITVSNAKVGETYSIYKMFDVYSFDDGDTSPGRHVTDKYSYVIAEDSPWYEWLTTTKSYAAEKPSTWTESTAPASSQLFWLDGDPIVINNKNYREVSATSNYTNTYDVADADEDASATTSTDSGFGKFDYDTTDYVSSDKNSIAAVQKFAQEALAFAKTLTGDYAAFSEDAINTTVTFDNLPLGYYLMGTTMGTLASLDTTNKSVTVYEKNEEPTILKKVSTDLDGTYQENISADVGDRVYFKTEITAKQGAKGYKLHDVMENGLTYGQVENTEFGKIEKVVVTRSNTDYTVNAAVPASTAVYPTLGTASGTSRTTSAAETNYTESSKDTQPPVGDDGCDFEIAFEDKLVVKDNNNSYYDFDIKDGDKITVYYSASVNNSAVIYNTENNETSSSDTTVKYNDDTTNLDEQVKKDSNTDQRNTNSTVLTYGNKSRTQWDTATVTVYEFDVVKTEADAADGTADRVFNLLQGAEFNLFKAHVTSTDQGSTDTVDRTVGTTNYTLDSGALHFFAVDSNGKYVLKDDTVDQNNGGDLYTSQVAQGDTTLTSSKTLKMTLSGLASGTYILEDTKAPTGYNKLAHPIVITITDGGAYEGDTPSYDTNEGTITTTVVDNNGATTTSVNNGSRTATIVAGSTGNPSTYNTAATNGGVQVINNTGQELPSTGGIGTTVFYVVGGILVAGSAVLLITKKRMSTEI